MGILQGMRVVEGSAFVAVPLAGMSLAQMGADGAREAAFTAPPVEAVIEPAESDIQIMAETLPKFRELYSSTQHLLSGTSSDV